MKTRSIFFFIIILNSFVFTQSKNYEFSIAPNYEIPIGNLSNRFKPTLGYSFNFKISESENWKWLAIFYHSSFSKPNYDKLIKRVEVQSGLDKEIFNFPLKLDLSLKTTSLLAEANYSFYKNNYFNSNFVFSFGFTNWTFKREKFKDSLFVTLNNSNTQTKVSLLDVPSNSQTDWSGTLLLGIKSSFSISRNFDFYLQTHYKLIIGELWPALSLDMENVSGLQSINLIFGIKAKL